MCQPQKCCFMVSLKKATEILIIYDGLLLAAYTFTAFGYTLAAICNYLESSQASVATVWALLSLFLIKFICGAFVNRASFKPEILGVYFVSRLVSNIILFILALIYLASNFRLELMAAIIPFFSLEGYLLYINYGFYNFTFNQRISKPLPKTTADPPTVVQSKLVFVSKFIPVPKPRMPDSSSNMILSRSHSFIDL